MAPAVLACCGAGLRSLAVAALERLRCGPSVASLATPPSFCTQVWGATGISLILTLTLTIPHPDQVWGVTGMVLAVPITAVARIYLASVEHPLLRYLAAVLAGTTDERSELSGGGGGDADGGGEGGGDGGGDGGGGDGGGGGVELEAADELAREIGVPGDPLERGRRDHGVVDLATSNPNWR